MKRKLLVLIFLITFFNNSKAQSLEYTLKASFIEKFARFTEWESNSIGEYFEIDILGDSPFTGELEKMANKSKIKNKSIKINYIKNYYDANVCQVLFICSSEKHNVSKIIKYFGKLNILMVADTPGFSELGVHFNFYYKENGTIHFEVNPKALNKAQLKYDMQLLNIGKIINQVGL
jgi:hypothetical protein